MATTKDILDIEIEKQYYKHYPFWCSENHYNIKGFKLYSLN